MLVTIAQLISRQAAERPGDTFLMFGDKIFTFGYLGQRVRRIASSLSAFGVKPGDQVGLMMPNHPDHVFLYLALSWIGATIIEGIVRANRLELG